VSPPNNKELPRFNKTQLADIFGLHRNTVNQRLKNIKPCGTDKRRRPIYTIPKAAQWLVDFEEIKKPWESDEEGEDGVIDPERLPPDMAKDYWDAKLKEQKWYENDGDLWSSLEVLELFSGLLKPLTSSIRGLSDTVERKAKLSPKQAELVQQEVDATLREAHKRVVEYAGILPDTE